MLLQKCLSRHQQGLLVHACSSRSGSGPQALNLLPCTFSTFPRAVTENMCLVHCYCMHFSAYDVKILQAWISCSHCAGVLQRSMPVPLQAFLDRYQQRSRASRRTADMRASVFPIPLPKPGE